MNRTTRTSYFLPIAIIGSLFFIFGFVTWLNGILIPYLQLACELTNYQALYVAFVFYFSYTLMALPSAWLLKKTGLKNGMMLGLLIMAAGTALFIPAAYIREFSWFLSGLFIMGTGLALLQTASNPYVTIMGPHESAAKRISILGICNKVAGAVAPLVLAYYILNDGDVLVESLKTMTMVEKDIALDALSRRVVNPYLVMTVILILLGLGIRLSPLPDIKADNETSNGQNREDEPLHTSVFSFPNLVLGAIALFFYVGAEVIAGDTIIRYGLSQGVSMNVAKAFTSYTMLAMIVGYILGIVLIPKYISQQTALKYSALLGILFSLLALVSDGLLSILFIALLGLANAIVWPAVWPLALNRLGRFINTGSAILIMAISGGAFIPLLWGKLADIFDEQSAYWVLLPLYAFIFYYAVSGYNKFRWKNTKR
jgi:MFS transporter, FHS family, L-fucose permease